MIELAENDEQRAIVALLTSEAVIGGNFTAPPGLPADRAAILRRGFESLVADPVLADLKSRDIEISPGCGANCRSRGNCHGTGRETVLRAIWAMASE